MSVIDRSAPGVRITLLSDEWATGGAPLDLGSRLIGFTFEDGERKSDKASLQLDNADLSLFDREDLQGGSVLEVAWGYPGQMAVPRRVVIKKLKGFTTLTVEGLATSALMNQDAKVRSWSHITRAQVVREIAEAYGYDGDLLDIEETEEVLDVINQSGETDARILRRLAAREGFEFYVDDGGLHFHQRRQSAAPTHVFTWYRDPGRGDVISISVESDLSRRTGRVTVRGRDPLSRRTIEHTTNNASATRETLAEVIEVVDPETGRSALETRNATASVRPATASTAKGAHRESAARFRQAERASVKLSMRVIGDPTLHAKSIVELRGISGLLSGKYYVTTVKHQITASGYTCDLKLVRDGSGRRARRLAQAQQGTTNTAATGRSANLTEVEAVNPETGTTHIEYRRDGQVIGAEDPEAGMSVIR